MFFLCTINETKSIFDIADDWNNILSLVISIGTVLLSFSSIFYFTRSISIEDPTKYTFKDVSEKDRYVIFKPAIIAITTIFISCIIGGIIVAGLSFNPESKDVVYTYILTGIFFSILGLCFRYVYEKSADLILKVFFWFSQKTKKWLDKVWIVKLIFAVVYFFIILIPIGIIGHEFDFNSIVYFILSSLIFSIYGISLLIVFDENKEDILVAEMLGRIFVNIFIFIIPGFIYYINHLDVFFYISCIGVLVFFVFRFIFLYNYIYSNYSNRQNLAYFYSKIKNNEDIYIYSKLDEFFVCNTKDYIECNNIEKAENIKKINEFKDKISKKILTLDNNKQKKFNDLVDDMFYYIKYLNSSESEMKDLFRLLASADTISVQDLDTYEDNIKKVFKTMDEKIRLEFIKIEDIKDAKMYYYPKNIKKFYNAFK
jgi:membrane protein